MSTTNRQDKAREEQALETIFKHGSSRTRAPTAVEAEVRKTLHDEWNAQVRQRRKRKRTVNWAIAASMVLALFMVSNLPRESVTGTQLETLARTEKTTGDVFVRNSAESQAKKLETERLLAGDEVSTIDGARIALRWENGESIRLDQNSRIELVSPSEIRLLAGRIYVDSAAAVIKGKAFRILTPVGQVSHIGTQYITELAVNGVFVSVREGEVSVGNSDGMAIARKGQMLQQTTDGQSVITSIASYGEVWQWTEKVSPGFNMDGRSLKELLDWVSRETGMQVEYGSAESKLAAAQTQLHGQLDLEPLRTMELVLQTSDLTHVLKDGVILVTL